MKEKRKIYSIVVAYYPNIESLNKLIKELKIQTNFIVICNNSDYDLEIIDKNVKVFNFGENLGIAKAQNIGMKWAFENRADFVLLVDQDSNLTDDLVNKLLECYEYLTNKGYKIGLVGSQDFDKDTHELNKARIKKGTLIENTTCRFVEETLSSGSLIPKCAYDIIGGKDEKLFIDAVDFEYCWRLKKNGFLIVKRDDALLSHKLGEGKRKILGFINVNVPTPIRHYYQTRNFLLLVRKDYVPFYWKISTLIKTLIKFIIYPITLDKKTERLKYFWKGIVDGILGKTGRID